MLFSLKPHRILDVATGTGDFAVAAMRLQPAKINGVDLSEQMIVLARKKIERKRLGAVIQLDAADAENLPFATGLFDAATVGFGVRNFENLEKGLSEMLRTLRPGGAIAVLEFSKPSNRFFRSVYYFYFTNLLPLIGKLISGNNDAYTYLHDTVMEFPEGKEFVSIMEKVGFLNVKHTPLTFGIAAIYIGNKTN